MMRSISFCLVCLMAGACTESVGEENVTLGSGGSSSVTTAGDHGLVLRLPFRAGESRIFTRGYETESHIDYGVPDMDDRFAIDLAGAGCTSWRAPVLAATSGIVRINGNHGYGNNLFVDFGNGCKTHYAHLDEIVVVDNQWVHQGQQIGFEGNTGSVSGSSCPAHPGTHVHFVAMCDGVGVLPEPISGYTGLRSLVGSSLTSDNVSFARHPSGTLAKRAGHPEVYLIDSAGQLRWLTTEDALRSRRLYRDSREPFGLVVTIGEEEFACYAMGPVFDWPVTMRVTSCPDGFYYLTVNDRGDQRKWWVRGSPGVGTFPQIIASWGFRADEVVVNYAGCSYPEQASALRIRDGTVVHEASSPMFGYVAYNSFVYDIHPELVRDLGYGAEDVIEIPAGTTAIYTRGHDPARSEIYWEDLAGCGGSIPVPATPSGSPPGFGGFGGPLPPTPDAGVPMSVDAGMPPGAMDAGSVCVAGAPEICNGVDDDCDGVTDEGYDLNWDTGNCGRCDNNCTRDHTVAFCVRGACSFEACDSGYANRDGSWDNGCECAVLPEICNGVDDDCDGLVDEGGVCAPASMDAGVPMLPDAGHDAGHDAGVDAGVDAGRDAGVDAGYDAGHDAGTDAGSPPVGCVPRTETCNGADDDCDGVVDDGFDLSFDDANCGSCGWICRDGTRCYAGSCRVEGCRTDAHCVDRYACTRDTCVSGWCQHPEDDTLCPSGQTCNVDLGGCVTAGRCVSGWDCNDGIICTADSCISGWCRHNPIDAACRIAGQRCTVGVGCTGP